MSITNLCETSTGQSDPIEQSSGETSALRRTRASVGYLGARAWWHGVRPMLLSVLASPAWARALGMLARTVTRLKVQLCAGVGLFVGMTLCWLATPSEPLSPAATFLVAVAWWLGLILLLPATAVTTVPLVRAAYRHTIRGRVRGTYGLDGWASWWDLHRYLSASAVRRLTLRTRPSLATEVETAPLLGGDSVPHPAHVARIPLSECGTWLGRSVVGPVLGTDCYAAKRDTVGLLAPPQTGKTATLGHHVLDHRGPVLVTSTKTDLYDLCAGRREVMGQVGLFNPENLGGMPSTVWWPLVRGCADPQVAQQRAGLMVGATTGDPDKGEDRWDEWATAVLRALLLAAALSGKEMATVTRWVFNTAADPRKGGAGEALAVLQSAPPGSLPLGTAESLRQVLTSDARKTTESIFLTLNRAVQFMTDPTVAALVTPNENIPEFDVDTFLSGQGSLFLVGSERANGSTAPLLAAFTGHVFESAKQAAAYGDRGRLDPPLGMFLDEVALICPVPLDRWIPDSGGRGIHIVWAVQSPSQLVSRWGSSASDTIWNSTNAKLIFGGFTLDEDLDPISQLCGHRHETVTDPDGRERYERVRTCPPDRLRVLPEWHAVLIHRSTPATIVRTSPVWERKDLLPPPSAPQLASSIASPGAQGPGEAEDSRAA